MSAATMQEGSGTSDAAGAEAVPAPGVPLNGASALSRIELNSMNEASTP